MFLSRNFIQLLQALALTSQYLTYLTSTYPLPYLGTLCLRDLFRDVECGQVWENTASMKIVKY